MPSPRVDPLVNYQPRWAQRVSDIGRTLRGGIRPAARSELLGRAWALLAAAVHHYVGLHASRIGPVDSETRRDISSEKALDLLRNLDSGTWCPWNDPPGRVAAFVSTVARNGLVDHLRTAGPVVRESIGDDAGLVERTAGTARASDAAATREFVEALEVCAGTLGKRERTVWFFRVFYEMPSRQPSWSYPCVRGRRCSGSALRRSPSLRSGAKPR